MPVRLKTFPEVGSHAEQILTFIEANEGTTHNKIITGLEKNPGIVKKAIKALLDRGCIEDTPDENGYHHYSKKVR